MPFRHRPGSNFSTAVSLTSTASISVFESGFHFLPEQELNSCVLMYFGSTQTMLPLFVVGLLRSKFLYTRTPVVTCSRNQIRTRYCFGWDLFHFIIKVVISSWCSFCFLPGSQSGRSRSASVPCSIPYPAFVRTWFDGKLQRFLRSIVMNRQTEISLTLFEGTSLLQFFHLPF